MTSAAPPPTPLHTRLVDLVARHGPLPFSTVMEAALYDEAHGFYSAAGGAAGRRGDFITSPEVGPLFGAVVARALDEWWDGLGRPDPYLVVEAGAGVGTLAVSVLAAGPRCAPAMRYVLVERSPVLRERHGEHLSLHEPATALGVPGGLDGPVVASLAELPATEITGVVLANELLDNLPFDLLTRTGDGWAEVRVGVDDPDSPRPRLERHVVPASEAAAGAGDRWAPSAPAGAVIPWQRAAAEWVGDALDIVGAGRLVVLDYAVETTSELAVRPVDQWLRAYRGHERVGDPLDALGTADITVDVAIDQIASRAGAPEVSTQAEWLRTHGLDDLVDEGRAIWRQTAAVGDLAAIRARSRIREAEALVDPVGLGAFRVMEWTRG